MCCDQLIDCVQRPMLGDVSYILCPSAGMCNTEEAMAAAILLQMSSQGGNSGEEKSNTTNLCKLRLWYDVSNSPTKTVGVSLASFDREIWLFNQGYLKFLFFSC